MQWFKNSQDIGRSDGRDRWDGWDEWDGWDG